MPKESLDRLRELTPGWHVDLSRDVPAPAPGARRERDCVEDRTVAHVLREGGASDEAIRARFGYLPTPL